MNKKLLLLIFPLVLISSCGSGQSESFTPSIQSSEDFSESSLISEIISSSSSQLSSTLSLSSESSSSQVDKKLTLNKNTLLIEEGKSCTLKANVNIGTLDGLIWYSDNTEVATVDNGVVAAIKPGKAVITAILDDLTASCDVKVRMVSCEKYMIEYFPYYSYYSHYDELIRNSSFKPDDNILEQYTYTIVEAEGHDKIDFYGVLGDQYPSFNDNVILENDLSRPNNNLKKTDDLYEVIRDGDNLVLTFNIYYDHYSVYLTGGKPRT